MSQKRIHWRKTGKASFPYWRSTIAAMVLVPAVMLLLAALADPRSGQIRSPWLAALALLALVLGIGIAFYAETRLRAKRPGTADLRPKAPSGMCFPNPR